MKKALYPGSFDPVTCGHLDVIERASKLADALEVVIMHNPNKKEAVFICGCCVVMDYEYDTQQATANQVLAPDIETVCLLTSPKYSFLSSSVVKSIAVNDGDISRFVPAEIVDMIKEKYKAQ